MSDVRSTATLRRLHDQLGSMIDQVGHPDYSLREMVNGLRVVRDELFALARSEIAHTNNAAPQAGSSVGESTGKAILGQPEVAGSSPVRPAGAAPVVQSAERVATDDSLDGRRYRYLRSRWCKRVGHDGPQDEECWLDLDPRDMDLANRRRDGAGAQH